MRALLPALLTLLLLPSVAACHPGPCDPECIVPNADCAWDDPPFGLVPYASECADSLRTIALFFVGTALDDAVWGVETAFEVLFGC